MVKRNRKRTFQNLEILKNTGFFDHNEKKRIIRKKVRERKQYPKPITGLPFLIWPQEVQYHFLHLPEML